MSPLALAFIGLALVAAIVFLVLFIASQKRSGQFIQEIDRLRQQARQHDGKARTDTAIGDAQARIHALQHELAVRDRDLVAARTKLSLATAATNADGGVNGTALLPERVAELRRELEALSAIKNLADIAFYDPSFSEQDSAAYRSVIDANNDAQKIMLKAQTAAVCDKTWTVGGDAKAGEVMVKAIVKLALRAFNGESDASIGQVTWKNYTPMRNRIEKSFSSINTLINQWEVRITDPYLKLKLEQLRLTYEHAEMVQRERDEQKALREQMRDEEKALKEAERAKLEAEREEQRTAIALEKARAEMERAHADQKATFQARVSELEILLAAAHQESERATSMAQLTKRGHVYIISNIGSFGDQVYKIGMTRRLVPMDRIDELGDASVPFDFDVHGLITTEDAPSLEAELHRRFGSRRVNMINHRKEFFQVSISEIQSACLELKLIVELTMAAEAKEYNQSKLLRYQHQSRDGSGKGFDHV